MTVTGTQIARAQTAGLINVPALAAACDHYKFPFYLACTILDKETDGRNIFGHDRGGSMSGPSSINIEVTEELYQQFKKETMPNWPKTTGGKTSNGVGPMQLTYKPFFPQMELDLHLKPWVVEDNMLFGVMLLNNTWKASNKSIYAVGKTYNGNRSYGLATVALAKKWKSRVGTDDLNATPTPGPVTPVQAFIEPGDKNERITYADASGTFRTTTRTLAMYKEACRLFMEAGGGTPPLWSQGGFNAGGVAASAGTHDRDAVDWMTRLMATPKATLWQACVWRVGFASWMRPLIVRLWKPHTHAIPKDGDLSAGAASQEKNFYNGRDGLVSNRTYPNIISSGLAEQTWEKYLAKYVPPKVSLSILQDAFANRKTADDVKAVQRALNRVLGMALAVDGDPGPFTLAAYAKFDPDATVDQTTLEALGLEVLL
jgi:hypothetical protein